MIESKMVIKYYCQKKHIIITLKAYNACPPSYIIIICRTFINELILLKNEIKLKQKLFFRKKIRRHVHYGLGGRGEE